jgi:hypothetical protein
MNDLTDGRDGNVGSEGRAKAPIVSAERLRSFRYSLQIGWFWSSAVFMGRPRVWHVWCMSSARSASL